MIKKIIFNDKELIQNNVNFPGNKILKKKKRRKFKYVLRRKLLFKGYYASKCYLLEKKIWYNQKKNIILYKNFFKKYEITIINDFIKNL